MNNPTLESEITCPDCGARRTEPMPVDACQFFYECKGCKTVLRPRSGDCCVFCSYGKVPCPPKQAGAAGGCCA
jgi:hypothetical protein